LKRDAPSVLLGKPEGKRPLGRTRRRWEDNIKMNLQEIRCMGQHGVDYASETWLLKESMINKLMIFERRIMRKIFGPTRTDNGYWRIKTNQEINEILKGQNIIGFIKKKKKIKLDRQNRTRGQIW
jgi:hypothetical protein